MRYTEIKQQIKKNECKIEEQIPNEKNKTQKNQEK